MPSDWDIYGFFENHWLTIVEEKFLLEKGSVVWGYVFKRVWVKDRENRIYVIGIWFRDAMVQLSLILTKLC